MTRVRGLLLGCAFAGGLLLLALTAGQGSAESMEEDGCRNDRTPGIVVVYCTRVIQSGQLSGAKLAQAYGHRGWAYRKQGKYDLALADLDAAIKLDPNNAYAFDERGIIREHRKEYARAISDYDAAIGLRSDDADFWDDRGIAYDELGQSDRAIQDYNEAIRLNPNDSRALNNRGEAYRGKGQYDLAIRDYVAALRIEPDYTLAVNNLAHVYADTGRYEQALAQYRGLLQKNPDDALTLNNRCWVLVMMRRAREGLGDCDRSLALKSDAYTFDSRGFAHLQLGDLPAAIADFDHALQLNPKMASSLFGRAKAKERQGDKAGAARDYAAARAIDANIEAELTRQNVLPSS